MRVLSHRPEGGLLAYVALGASGGRPQPWDQVPSGLARASL